MYEAAQQSVGAAGINRIQQDSPSASPTLQRLNQLRAEQDHTRAIAGNLSDRLSSAMCPSPAQPGGKETIAGSPSALTAELDGAIAREIATRMCLVDILERLTL